MPRHANVGSGQIGIGMRRFGIRTARNKVINRRDPPGGSETPPVVRMAAIALEHLGFEVGGVSHKRQETVPYIGGRLRIAIAKRIGISNKTGRRMATLACAAVPCFWLAGGGSRNGGSARQPQGAVTGPVIMRPCAAEVACRRSG